MSILITRNNLISTFIASWTYTVATDNINYKPDGSSYVLAQIAPSYSEQPCLGRDSGATWERDVGDLVLQVHIPINSEDDGLAIAESARALMSQQRFDETITDVGRTVVSGVSQQDGQYFVYSVVIPFRTDNLKS